MSILVKFKNVFSQVLSKADYVLVLTFGVILVVLIYSWMSLIMVTRSCLRIFLPVISLKREVLQSSIMILQANRFWSCSNVGVSKNFLIPLILIF